jgi:catechol 2,3-dioxygenase-like lactoylglutathione lyase family enzyme
MSANRNWVFAFGVAAVIVVGLASAPQQTRGAAQTASILGTGRGIDHVIVIVRDLGEAARTYTEVLGFTVARGGSFPGGLRNRAAKFASTYIEFMSVDPSQAPPDDELVRLLKEREGGYAFGLSVSSAQQTADALRARNFDVTGPTGSSLILEGSKDVQRALWQTVAITKPVLPFQPLFFIQYAPRETRSRPSEHQNTAVDVHSVWIVVKDLETATKGYGALGLRPGRKQRMPQLAAKGREISAGQGVILLLQATDTKGPLASYVAQHGEGVIGMSIEVRDLQIARSLLRSSTKQELNPYNGPYGKSVFVPPAFTHGVWIELFQGRGV